MKKFAVSMIVVCLALCFLTTIGYPDNLDEKFQRGMSQKDLYDELQQIYTDYRVSWAHFYDGQTLGAFLVESSEHYKLTLKSGFAVLSETPDAGTTLTVTLYNHSAAITDTLTFSSGPGLPPGQAQAFTVQDNNGLEETAGLRVVIGGTTSTNGELTIHTEWRGTQ